MKMFSSRFLAEALAFDPRLELDEKANDLHVQGLFCAVSCVLASPNIVKRLKLRATSVSPELVVPGQ